MKVSRDGEVTDDIGRRIGRVRKLSHVWSIFTGPPGSDMVYVDGRCGWAKQADAVVALQKHVAEHSPPGPVEPGP